MYGKQKLIRLSTRATGAARPRSRASSRRHPVQPSKSLAPHPPASTTSDLYSTRPRTCSNSRAGTFLLPHLSLLVLLYSAALVFVLLLVLNSAPRLFCSSLQRGQRYNRAWELRRGAFMARSDLRSGAGTARVWRVVCACRRVPCAHAALQLFSSCSALYTLYAPGQHASDYCAYWLCSTRQRRYPYPASFPLMNSRTSDKLTTRAPTGAPSSSSTRSTALRVHSRCVLVMLASLRFSRPMRRQPR